MPTHTKEDPKVSIMIASYNQRNFVTEAIESAVNQNYENLEVVISDDGSTDGTAEIIEQLQTRYGERLVALTHRKNVGITKNCNQALQACTGDYVTFIGGDDVLVPGKVVAQVEWFRKDPRRVLCGHAVEYIDDAGATMHFEGVDDLPEGTGPESFIRRTSLLPGTSIMVRASALPPHGFDENIPIASDFLFWIEVLAPMGKFGCVDGVYAKRRRHEGNITSLKWQEIYDDFERTYEIIAERYPQYRKLCKAMIVKHVVYHRGTSHLTRGNKRAARKNFAEALFRKPSFAKAWIRMLQTFW